MNVDPTYASRHFPGHPSGGTATGRIRAYNADGFSPWVSAAPFATHAFTRLNAPAFAAVPAGAGAVRLSWPAPSQTQVYDYWGNPVPVHYRVAYAPEDASFTATDDYWGGTQVPATDRQMTVTNLTPGVAYRFALVAVSSSPYVDYILPSLPSAFTVAAAGNAAPAPATKPAGVGAVNAAVSFGDAPYYDDPSKNKVKLTWKNVPNDETGFRIYRGVKSASGQDQVILSPVGEVAADVTTWTDSGMLPDNYIYSVAAVNAAGESSANTVDAAVWAPGYLAAFDGTKDYQNNPAHSGDLGNYTVIGKFAEKYYGLGNYERGVGNVVDHPGTSGLPSRLLQGAFGFEADKKAYDVYNAIVSFYQVEYNRKHVPLDIIGYSRGAFSAMKLVDIIARKGIPDLSKIQVIEEEVPLGYDHSNHRMLTRTREVMVAPFFSERPIRFLGLVSPVGQMVGTPPLRVATFGWWNTNFGWPTTVPSGVRHVTQLLDDAPDSLIYPETTMTYPPGNSWDPPVRADGNNPDLDHGAIGVNLWTWDQLMDASRGVNVPVSRQV